MNELAEKYLESFRKAASEGQPTEDLVYWMQRTIRAIDPTYAPADG